MIASVYFFIILLTIILGLQFYWRRQWAALVCIFSFVSRAVVCLLFLTDLQYFFVLDSIGYEQESWELAKSWASSLPTSSIRLESYANFNLYKIILAVVFYLFGRQVLLGMLMNAALASLTVFISYKICFHFFSKKAAMLTLYLLVLYPSFIIWSATNIRDPLYFLASVLLFYCFLVFFSKDPSFSPKQKNLAMTGLFASFAVVCGVRAYVALYFLSSVLLGVVVYRCIKRWSLKRTLIGASLFAIIVAQSLVFLAPQFVNENLHLLEQIRQSFSNEGYADVAQSSFALDYRFENIWDIFIFIPIGLVNYFFGPFFWNIRSTAQGLSQLEVFSVYLLILPTYLGVRKMLQKNPFATSLLVVFCLCMAIFQSLTISNLGTLFRHRTLGFILLSSFASVGILEVWEIFFRHTRRN